MMKPSGGALKKLFAPGRVKSATEAPSRQAANRSNDTRGKEKTGINLFGKARKPA